MRYPMLEEIPSTRDIVDVFAGYNHNLRIGSGEFYDMQNLSSDSYPVLSPRKKRGTYFMTVRPRGMISKDVLCYINGTSFYIDKYPVKGTLSDEVPKSLVSMGSYVIIMPDKKYVNTAKASTEEEIRALELMDIEASVTTKGAVTFTHSKADGTEYSNITVSDTEPENPTNEQYWIDTSSTPHTLKQYSSSSSMWVAVATTYIKISAVGIGAPFEEGDGVTISGITAEGLEDLNSTLVIAGRGDDYIIVTGVLAEVKTQSTPITVKRQMPNMDFMIESENRLWGCRYGLAVNGEIVNEIYASKLGDFKNWNCFVGISTDSYAATVGTDGQFTGAITHLGYPIFFKENCMHKVYGNYPANYQIQTTACRGVQKGCSKSLAIVNETLFYKAPSGVVGYDGSLPTEVSSALGEVNYKDAVAGALGNKYYISMADDEGKYSLFVLDTKKGLWHKEDNTRVVDFCKCRENLYYIDHADNYIKMVKGTEEHTDNAPIQWMAETGILGTDSPDKKYISRIDVRMSLAFGAKAHFYAEYDSVPGWEYLYTMTGTNLKSFSVPIRPRRCDHLRLRIVGEGDAKIYSISKTIEQGSDL
jgi:hypothetical protein